MHADSLFGPTDPGTATLSECLDAALTGPAIVDDIAVLSRVTADRTEIEAYSGSDFCGASPTLENSIHAQTAAAGFGAKWIGDQCRRQQRAFLVIKQVAQRNNTGLNDRSILCGHECIVVAELFPQ